VVLDSISIGWRRGKEKTEACRIEVWKRSKSRSTLTLSQFRVLLITSVSIACHRSPLPAGDFLRCVAVLLKPESSSGWLWTVLSPSLTMSV